MRFLRLILACAFVTEFGVSAFAQDSQIGKFTVDLAVPESPAFTVLGLTPQTVTRPSSPQQLATALLNGVDQNGNFQTGIAIDTQPYMLFYGRKMTWAIYRDHAVARFLSRAQLSIASAKGATEGDKSARLALGVRLTVFDLGDPFRDEATGSCLSQAEGVVLKAMTTPGPAATPAEIATYQAEKMKRLVPFEAKCRDDQAERARRTVWNDSSMVIGLAPSLIAPTGNTDDLQSNGGCYWTSLAYGFESVPGLEDSSQLIWHYRRRNQEQLPNPGVAGQFFKQDSDVMGVRWRFGTSDATGSFEYVFLQRRITGRSNDNSSRLSFAAERRIAGNSWLNVSFGSERGREDGSNNAFVLSSFNWSVNQRTQ